MVDVIKEFRYKTAGRGRGILGITDLGKCRRPLCSPVKPGGETASSDRPGPASAPVGHDGATKREEPEAAAQAPLSKLVVALFDYKANADSPGDFKELSMNKGQLLELVAEHPANEHWWEVRTEDGETGFVPATYVLIKDDQVLPWLQSSALRSEEEDRKERVKKLKLQKDIHEGKAIPQPKQLPPKPYVSSYERTTGQVKSQGSSHYCEVCEKSFNGPKPYGAHMASKAHREEVEVQNELRR